MSVPSVTGKTCPYCQSPIKPTAEAVVCNACGIPHHRECWQQNQRCTTYGCTGSPYLPTGGSMPMPQPMSAIPPPPPMPYQGQMPVMNQVYQTGYQQAMYLQEPNTLIVRERAVLPPICLATGKASNLVRKRRTEAWAPSWVLLIYLVGGLLIGAIVYAVIKKTATYEFFLEREIATRRLLLVITNWIVFLTCFIGSIATFSNDDTVAFGLILLLLSLLVPIIIYYACIRLYTVEKIENGYMWLKFRKPAMASTIYAAYCNPPQR